MTSDLDIWHVDSTWHYQSSRSHDDWFWYGCIQL